MKVKLKNVISDFLVPMRDKPKIFDGDIPWCRIEDIKGKYLSDTLSNQYVSKKTVKSMNLKVYPINTLLFTCSATIGVTAITKKSLCTNQTFIGLVASNEIEIEFLYYYLGLIGKDLIKAASVTTIPYLSKRFFENLEIELPSLRNQKQIAKVLSDLDAKIEVNNKINQELEAMAKTIYDYWFVQFDFPNEIGKPYKSSGGKMVFNKVLKRDIPEGWDIEKVSSSCQIVDCLHSKKSDYVFEHEDYYLLQLENIKQANQLDISKKFYVSKAEYRRWTTRIEVQDGDLVITNAGRVAGLAQIPENVKAGIGRNITAIRPKRIKPTFLYYTFQGAEMERQIKLNTDTGSFFKSLNVRGIKELLVLRPPKYLETEFEKFSLQHRRKRELNSLQNQKLTELRDWLLPLLMNGQVTVGEAEKEVEDFQIAAEPPTPYTNKEKNLTEIFESINLDYEVATIVWLTEKKLKRTFGKKYVHKTYSNMAFLNTLPVIKEVVFEENYWGMFSPAIAKTIENKKFIKFENIDYGQNVLKLNYKHLVEVVKWTKEAGYNKEFTEQVNNMLSIYEHPLIYKDMDRIELLNTVLECITVLKTYNFEKIYNKMKNWKMRENFNKTKAEKFNPNETKLMIELIKEINT